MAGLVALLRERRRRAYEADLIKCLLALDPALAILDLCVAALHPWVEHVGQLASVRPHLVLLVIPALLAVLQSIRPRVPIVARLRSALVRSHPNDIRASIQQKCALGGLRAQPQRRKVLLLVDVAKADLQVLLLAIYAHLFI